MYVKSWMFALVNKLTAKRLFRSTAVYFKEHTNIPDECKTNIQQISKTEKDGYIVKSVFPETVIKSKLLYEYMWRHLDVWGKQYAVTCGLSGRSYTYNELHEKSITFGSFLRWKMNLERGDVVAIMLVNMPEFFVALLGCIYADVTLSTVNPIYTEVEIQHQLVASGAKAIIVLVDFYKVLEKAFAGIPNQNIKVIAIKSKENQQTPPNCIDFKTLMSNNKLPPVDIVPKLDDVAFLPFSSGTTGFPKGVQLTQKNVLSNVKQLRNPCSLLLPETTATTQEIVTCILPLFHIYGMVVNGLVAVSQGIRLITLPRFHPESYLKVLETYRPSVIPLVPPLLIFLTNYPGVKPKHLEATKHILSAAAPLMENDVKKFHKKFKHVKIRQGYGMTEASPVTHFQFFNRELVPGSCGELISSTECKIIHPEDGKWIGLGPGERGELIIRGPQVMKGYLNNEKATAETIIDKNWLRTGDIGYYNENGLFFITDRHKCLIKVKGFQVAPAELEDILRHHKNVSDAAVIGVSDPISGQVPKAFIVPNPGEKVDIDDVHKFVNAQVAKYKRLRGGIEIIDAIPRNASGKILRNVLRDREKSKK